MKHTRLITQLVSFLIQNPFLNNFFTGKIYDGELKRACTPGLNCYSCPAAAVSCPMGALQLFFAGAKQSISLYVIGFLLSTGVVFGKFICGFVCPMGLAQDLLYRIKSRKLILRLRFIRYTKYLVLALFVIILPLVVRNEISGLGTPWFCTYICPSGTLFGAVPLLAANDFLHQFIGILFFLKISVLIIVV
ncbi:MAG: 4Fe-4S binding protein, partial [Clostridiales bacterium]|nr:4Fe-4S binding protein [Clostridiales bacterium]